MLRRKLRRSKVRWRKKKRRSKIHIFVSVRWSHLTSRAGISCFDYFLTGALYVNLLL